MGTLDEIFETLTQIQTGKMDEFPLVVMGKKFWNPIRNFIDDGLVQHKTIDEEDLRRFFFTDEPHEAASYIYHKLTKYHGFEADGPNPYVKDLTSYADSVSKEEQTGNKDDEASQE